MATSTSAPRHFTRPQAHRRKGLAAFAVLVAVSAWFGVYGLVSGALSIGADLEQRLPFGSPVLGGIALALVVAAPTSYLAWSAWRGAPSTDLVSVACGVLVIGWIVVQYLFIRQLSFFHPTYVVVGALLVWAGRRSLPGSRE
jgi:hypothetical protein